MIPLQLQHHEQKPSVGADDCRHYLRVFIQTYRDLPVLWDTSLRDYTNREKRAQAYDQLVPIYRYLKKDANVDDVKKKINTLRTNYRKELKVVESARRSGNIHHPRCWTFAELDFLRNTEKFLAVTPGLRGGGISGVDSTFFSDATHQSHASTFVEGTPFNFRSILSAQTPPTINEMFHKTFGSGNHNASGTAHNEPAAATPIKRQRMSPPSSNSQSPPDELLGMACDYLNGQFPEEESLARTWTLKLKRMPKEQRLLAEKFINEIIFEGENNNLHRGSLHVNHFPLYGRFDNSTAAAAAINQKHLAGNALHLQHQPTQQQQQQHGNTAAASTANGNDPKVSSGPQPATSAAPPPPPPTNGTNSYGNYN